MKSNNLFDEASEIFITEKDAEFFAVFVDKVMAFGVEVHTCTRVVRCKHFERKENG